MTASRRLATAKRSGRPPNKAAGKSSTPRKVHKQAKVRVVRTKHVDSWWFTGCKLTKRLSDVDLGIWCSGPLDWPDRQCAREQSAS